MKILKIYDKINRNILHIAHDEGTISINEYVDDLNYFCLTINTKIFKLKGKNIAYLSYINVVNAKILESLDVTSKYILYNSFNEEGLLIHSEMFNLKDSKASLKADRIYDSKNEFIEIENHRGNRTVKFKVKNEILIKLLNIIENG